MYCLVAGRRPPRLTHKRRGLPGMARPRLLDVSDHPRAEISDDRRAGRWLIVADAPLTRYGERAISRGLSDLDWVARAAVAHEGVVESFIDAQALLPMKLFTIFSTDERARDYVRRAGRRIDRLIDRVADHQEWGVRVVFDSAGARPATGRTERSALLDASGKRYLMRKKAQRDQVTELAQHARKVAAGLYGRLAGQSRLARRRKASELQAQVPLLLDAAFLVPVGRATRFRRLVARNAQALLPNGYRITLTGPWPPYSFVQD